MTANTDEDCDAHRGEQLSPTPSSSPWWWMVVQIDKMTWVVIKAAVFSLSLSSIRVSRTGNWILATTYTARQPTAAFRRRCPLALDWGLRALGPSIKIANEWELRQEGTWQSNTSELFCVGVGLIHVIHIAAAYSVIFASFLHIDKDATHDRSIGNNNTRYGRLKHAFPSAPPLTCVVLVKSFYNLINISG